MFDLDGTLVETGGEIAAALNEALVSHGHAALSQKMIEGWIGEGTRQLLSRALTQVTGADDTVLAQDGRLDAIRQRFDASYQQICGTTARPYPAVVEALKGLRARDVSLAVVTNKDRRFADAVLRASGLAGYFGLVLGGDDLPAKKPDPAGIHHCLRHYGLAPHQALFIGDSSIDAAAARNAGVPVWLLPYGYNMNRSVHDCAPDRVIADMSALL